MFASAMKRLVLLAAVAFFWAHVCPAESDAFLGGQAFFDSLSAIQVKYTVKRTNHFDGSITNFLITLNIKGGQYVGRISRSDATGQNPGAFDIVAYNGMLHQHLNSVMGALVVSRKPLKGKDAFLWSFPMTEPFSFISTSSDDFRQKSVVLKDKTAWASTYSALSDWKTERRDNVTIHEFSRNGDRYEVSVSHEHELFPVSWSKQYKSGAKEKFTVGEWLPVTVAGKQVDIPAVTTHDSFTAAGKLFTTQVVSLVPDSLVLDHDTPGETFMIPSSLAETIYDLDIQQYIKTRAHR